jgi:hypothetical protein
MLRAVNKLKKFTGCLAERRAKVGAVLDERAPLGVSFTNFDKAPDPERQSGQRGQD